MERGNVFKQLRKEILDLTLRPGSELDLNETAAKYGVSRSPVRDAVKELCGEKLVDIYPQKGTYISRINLPLAEDERFIRLSLELGAVKESFSSLDSSIILLMEENIEKQERAFASRDTSSLLSLDDEFHAFLFKAAKRENVYSFILSRNGNYHRLRLISFMFDSIAQGVIEQHKALLEAIKEKNEEKFLSLDCGHMSKLTKETDSFRASMPQYFQET